jgi:hypothetical protein
MTINTRLAVAAIIVQYTQPAGWVVPRYRNITDKIGANSAVFAIARTALVRRAVGSSSESP